jgi:hypothetical protein
MFPVAGNNGGNDMSSFMQKIALSTLAIGLLAIPAAAEDSNYESRTLYDRGERALDFLALERGMRGAQPSVRDPVSTGSIAPRAEYAVTSPGAAQGEWWAAHEAIRRQAEDR